MEAIEFVEQYEFEKDAEFPLDSIAWQIRKIIAYGLVDNELFAACEIARRYSDPVSVLKKLDRVMPGYLKRRTEGFKYGSLSCLNHEEGLLDKEHALILDGFDTRVEVYLLGMDPSECEGQLGSVTIISTNPDYVVEDK